MDRAVRMAELEKELGIRSTYYVRSIPKVFRPDAIRRLHELGHEVGYHYEVLSRSDGDAEEAIALFEQDLRRFREIVPVDTVSMHGSPLSPWNNLDLWQRHDWREYGLVGDAVLSMDGEDLYYFTDTGRSWETNASNLRDHVPCREPDVSVAESAHLMSFIESRPEAEIYISAHPNRWTDGLGEWTVSRCGDWVVNRAKSLISFIR
jgi:hypothetical protein